ncbi:MAG: cysteine hydrolase [candidate division WOR-3 bacterium]|nr:MAG: cysteine hydrolase [candidate division WOR-3 bacterium]
MKEAFELRKDTAALLIIDMQKYFRDKESDAQVPGMNQLVPNMKNLIQVFNENNCPIIFTRHIDSDDKDNLMLRWWKEQIREDDELSQVIEDFDTSGGKVIIKHQYDAFLYTDLEEILKKKKIKQIVICGVLTNICCETTARSAFMRGFEVYFVTDATATYKKEMHEAALLNLSYGFAVLMTTADVLMAMK